MPTEAFSFDREMKTKSIDIIQNPPSPRLQPHHVPFPPLISNYGKFPRPKYSFVLIFRHPYKCLQRRRHNTLSRHPFHPHHQFTAGIHLYLTMLLDKKEKNLLQMRRRENTKIKLCNLCFTVSCFLSALSTVVKAIFLVAKEGTMGKSSLSREQQSLFHYVTFYWEWHERTSWAGWTQKRFAFCRKIPRGRFVWDFRHERWIKSR